MPSGAHDHATDPRNDEILIWVNGELKPRAEAVVRSSTPASCSATASGRGSGSHGGHPAFLEQHLDRLWEGATALMIDLGVTREELTAAVYETLAANEMTDGVHVRLMFTRGVKSTPYQDPRVTVGPATIVIIAEHKEPTPATVERRAGAVHHARPPRRHRTPSTRSSTRTASSTTSCLHPGLHRRRRRGADARPARLRRDLQQHPLLRRRHAGPARCGRRTAGSASAGITRGNVLAVCRAHGITALEKTFSLTDVYSAREAFVTGTFAGVAPVRSVDGRTIGPGGRGPVVERLQELYAELVAADVAARAAP